MLRNVEDIREKLNKIYLGLHNHFGPQYWWPTISNSEFEISIGAILTQNISWNNVEKSIKELNNKNLLSKEGIEKIDEEKLSFIIRSSGYYKQKAKKLKEFVKFLNSGKKMTRGNLLNVWGIGEETADSILLYAYNKPVFVIDAYTKRIMWRLGFRKLGYRELQSLFMSSLDKNVKLYKEYHALLVKLGKDYCKKKPLCEECPLKCKKKSF